MKIRISARQSELAQLQAYLVGDALMKARPGLQPEFLFRESLGDKNLTDPLWKMPEKGVFTEDFNEDLLQGRTDLVVHSWKDLPTESKNETVIAATLPRADQRDFLLFKKKSFKKENLKIFSSSPRRSHNLTSFFNWAIPWPNTSISFESVRGNIPTRIRKWLNDDSIDGLVLAKAAIDRLLLYDRFDETKKLIQQVLNEECWMVLPLTANPNAAAQGALAVEIKKDRKDLIELLQKINCRDSYEAAEAERLTLQAFGGGCHLALGISCLIRSYGKIEIVQGLSPQGEVLNIKQLKAKKSLPLNTKIERLKFESRRKPVQIENANDYDVLYVAKAEAWNLQTPYKGVTWASGLETWKKLSEAGIWVSGSSESLGENEDARIDHYFSKNPGWARLTHDKARAEGHKAHLTGYELELYLLSNTIETDAAYYWKSPLEFDIAVAKFPELKEHLHVCGPGRTYEALLRRLGGEEKLFLMLV